MRKRKSSLGRVRAKSAGSPHHIGEHWTRRPDRRNRRPRGKYLRPYLVAMIHRSAWEKRMRPMRINWLQESVLALRARVVELQEAHSRLRASRLERRKALHARALLKVVSRPDTWPDESRETMAEDPRPVGKYHPDMLEVRTRQLKTAIQLVGEELLYWRSNREELQLALPRSVSVPTMPVLRDLLAEHNISARREDVLADVAGAMVVVGDDQWHESVRETVRRVLPLALPRAEWDYPPYYILPNRVRPSDRVPATASNFEVALRAAKLATSEMVGRPLDFWRLELRLYETIVRSNLEAESALKARKMALRYFPGATPKCRTCKNPLVNVLTNFYRGAWRGTSCVSCVVEPPRWEHRTPWGDLLKDSSGVVSPRFVTKPLTKAHVLSMEPW